VSGRPDATAWDPRAEIRRRAAAAGVDLPDGIIDELAAHLRDARDDALAGGATPDDALRRAHQVLDESPFAALARHAARHPDRARARRADADARLVSTGSWSMLAAVAAAVRHLRRTPTFAAVTVLVLGVGMGAATTVFTIVDAVVLRPLPFRDPDALVTLWDTNPGKAVTHDPISPVNFMDYRALPVFSDAAAWWRPAVNLVDPGQDPVRVRTIEVSGNLFELLGVGPQVGPGFPAGGPLFSQERIAVISDRLWRTRYHGDPGLVGKSLLFNGAAYTVAGVMPPGFHYPGDVDVWWRLQWDMTQHSRAAHFMESVLRLAPGTTVAEARRASETLGQRLEGEFVDSNRGWVPRLVPLLDESLGYYRPALAVLLGAVALLLAIAVLNVASLLLTRALARAREMAVRVALGASSRHLMSQLLAESAVLSAAGALLGVALTAAALPVLRAVLPVSIPRLDQAAVDGRVLAAALAVVVVTTLVFGVVPALWVLCRPAAGDLRQGDRGSSRGARRLYSVLVAGEVALAGALLVASALLVRTVHELVRTPTGVDADQVLTVPVQLTATAIGATASTPVREYWTKIADTHTRLLDAVRSMPGVERAGGANFLPFGVGWRNPFAVEGQERPARQEDLPQAQLHTITEGYLEAMGVRVVDGRPFEPHDGVDARPVAIVNETLARRYLGGGRAVGRRLRLWATGIGPLGRNLMARGPLGHDGMVFEIVGVTADVANGPIGQPVEPALYFSGRQFPFGELFVAVKASSPAVARTAVAGALRAVTPTEPMGLARTWADRFAGLSAEARVLMAVLVVFGGLAAVLAALGVYGLFSWSIDARTRELAIRMSLGARPAAVGGAVMRQAALLVAAGLLTALVVVRLADAVLARVLYGVTAGDAAALVTASLVLGVAALGAVAPAARRAMRVDPAVGLRAE
jgi:putative ABC transport system permease protein